MQSFHIIRKSKVDKTFRVAKLMSDFDIKIENSEEEFVGEIEMPEEWQIGVIYGGSGTGKTTIAKELFKDNYITNFEYRNKSVIDDFSKTLKTDDIIKTLYAVGFGSVPSWLKPYDVLSNGEKMRVNLARAFLEYDEFVFDEFTSVVDRRVAETACIAIKKAITRTEKRMIVISCHKDIIEWLSPDWVFNTNKMTMDDSLKKKNSQRI